MLRKISAYLSLISLVALTLAPAMTASAAPRNGNHQRHVEKKAAPEFSKTNGSTATVRVLIQTKGAPTAAQDGALARAHGNKRASYDALNMIVADVPLNEVAGLAARADVLYVAPDRPVKAQMNLTNDTTGVSQVQAGQAGAPGFDGKGVTIAILDSGISANHPDFVTNNKSRVIASVDFSASTRSGDADGHGTGVAGVAAGSGATSGGYAANYAGVAPGAYLVDLRVLDENGVGRTSNVLAALNWLIQNRERYNIRVANLSLSMPVRESFHTDPLCKAVELAVRSGIVVVCSAGNLGRTDVITGYNADGSAIYSWLTARWAAPATVPM
jgi:serine protease AprX